MNAFFKKGRKTKEPNDTYADLTGEGQTPTKTSKSLKRKKKHEMEEKLVLDLSNVLPDRDDFRTSLIMPNLSARFSMLREQDDPDSKLGKAADDSVLFPKRASRLNLFNHSPLADIAEVESIHASFRPPFADQDRSAPTSDGYASDDGGSVMSRSRPGEGNSLFGGRQKFYRIPTSSTRTLAGDGSSGAGKHVHEPDTTLPMFRQVRPHEQEYSASEDVADLHNTSHPEEEEPDMVTSPSTGFSKNRGTQSSTNSGPSNRRTSTAATSVVFDSPVVRRNSNTTVSKAVEPNANSSLESVGFSASPSFLERHGKSSLRLSHSRSAVDLRDSDPRPAFDFFSPALRALSPTDGATADAGVNGLDFGLRDVGRKSTLATRLETTSPTKAAASEQDDVVTYANSVPTVGRGKATALGPLDKSQANYDEHHFSQCQKQMLEGRSSPASIQSRPAQRSSADAQEGSRQSDGSFVHVPSPSPQDRGAAPQVPPIPTESSLTNDSRASVGSGGRATPPRVRAKSNASTASTSVKARVESLIKRQNAELAAMEAEQFGKQAAPLVDASPDSLAKEVSSGVLSASSDSSDDEDREPIRSTVKAQRRNKPLSPLGIHPALRDETKDATKDVTNQFNFDLDNNSQTSSDPVYTNLSRSSATSVTKATPGTATPEKSSAKEEDESASTSVSGLGLSGLVRTHLRHDSDRSSFYPQPSPRASEYPVDPAREPVGTSAYDHLGTPVIVQQPPTPTAAMSQHAQSILGRATALRDASEAQKAEALECDDLDGSTHQRNASTETQKEQQRFDDELAERRRRIQEGLKTVQEGPRSRSPGTGAAVADSNEHSGIAFSLPRFGRRPSHPDRAHENGLPKSSRILGIGPHIGPHPRYTGEPRPSEEDRARDFPLRSTNRAPHGEEQHHNGRDGPGHNRPHMPSVHNPNDGSYRHPPRAPTPSGRSSRTRDRSTSGAMEHLKSRNRHRDDVEPPLPRPQDRQQPRPYLVRSPSPRRERKASSATPPESRCPDRSQSAMSDHYKDRHGYFHSRTRDARPEMSNGFSPRPSPNHEMHSEPNSSSTTPVPRPMSPPPPLGMASPEMHHPGPASGRATPNHNPTGRATPTSGSRKKPVVKGMISEPTFVSSTSSVPLQRLPHHGGPPIEFTPLEDGTPALPAMNPRRRGNTTGERPAGHLTSPVTHGNSHSPSVGTGRPMVSLLPSMPESPRAVEFERSDGTSLYQGQPQSAGPVPRSVSGPASASAHGLGPGPLISPAPRSRNRLRKTSSEGGSLAAKARHHAYRMDMAHEQNRSPALPVFPNRSATALEMARETNLI